MSAIHEIECGWMLHFDHFTPVFRPDIAERLHGRRFQIVDVDMGMESFFRAAGMLKEVETPMTRSYLGMTYKVGIQFATISDFLLFCRDDAQDHQPHTS